VWRRSRSITAALWLCAAPAFAGSPELDYTLNCAGCHRADGAGTPGSVPPLAGAVGKFLRVPGGREFLVQVPGVATSELDDAALAAVLTWTVRRFDAEQVPADFVPFSAEEVGRLRKAPLTNVERVRIKLLQGLD
jgi:mono/diheme cytochrome c family protein